MRLITPAILFVLSLSSGCTHMQLKRSTALTASTGTDIHTQQVLDNLAMFSHNPASLPHFAVVGSGSTQISDRGAASLGLNWNPFGLVSEMFGLNIDRNVSEEWDVANVTDPERLQAMRCAYLYTLGQCVSACDPCCERFQTYLGHQPTQCEIPQGEWFEVSCHKPLHWKCRDCRFVGSHCGTYVTVSPENVECLRRLTLTILSIATAGPPVTPYQYTMKFTPDGTLLEKSVEYLSRTPPNGVGPRMFDPSQNQGEYSIPPMPAPAGVGGHSRLRFDVPQRGLMFVP